EIAEAERFMREGLRFADGLGMDLARRWAHGNLAECLFHLGEWDESLAFADEEIEDPESHYLQALCRRNRALIRLARGDRDGALAHALVELKRESDLVEFRHTTLRTPWHETALAIVDGDLVGAADRLRAMGSKSFEAHARLTAVRMLREAGRVADAEAQLVPA